MFLHIAKIIIAGFLVSLNIFSFLLVKCQKNDRERLILKGIAKGNSEIDFEEKPPQPTDEERQSAKENLLSQSSEDEDEDFNNYTDTENGMPKDKKRLKKQESEIVDKYTKKPVSDIKLLFCALLGGSVGIYIALFAFRYRLRDIVMMVLVPTILVLNIYFYLQVFTVWLILPLSGDVTAAIKLSK